MLGIQIATIFQKLQPHGKLSLSNERQFSKYAKHETLHKEDTDNVCRSMIKMQVSAVLGLRIDIQVPSCHPEPEHSIVINKLQDVPAMSRRITTSIHLSLRQTSPPSTPIHLKSRHTSKTSLSSTASTNTSVFLIPSRAQPGRRQRDDGRW